VEGQPIGRPTTEVLLVIRSGDWHPSETLLKARQKRLENPRTLQERAGIV